MKNTIFRISVILLSAVMLTGCMNTKNESSGEISLKINDNSMLDISDLERSGTYERRIDVTFYEISDGYENSPIYNYDQYKSPEGETFAFDSEGRLVYYGQYIPESPDSETNREKLSEDKLTEISSNALSACISNFSDYDTEKIDFQSKSGDNCIPYRRTLKYENGNGSADYAIAELNDYGDITSIEIYYNAVLSADEQSYFDKKVSEYTSEVNDRNPLKDYSYTVQYHRTNKTLFALYTFDFTETDGAEFCEKVGFTMALTDE